ncbi:MAG: M56 family metallopeptidase [Chitinophagales bacterium]
MFFFGIPIAVGTNFLQALGWAVINSLWQMAFLWVIFQVLLSFGIDKSSAKSRLATILLSTGFAWFLYTLIFHWLIDPLAIKRSLLAIGSFEKGNAALNEQLQTILPYASIAYLLLLIVPSVQFIRNYRFVQVIRKTGLSKCNVDLRIFVQRLGERMGIRKPVHVYISDLITSPVTIGFLKPIILMPIAAITNLSGKQVEAILLHELAHIRRYDYLINLLINFIKTILYFNPFVKLFARTIEKEREKSCDEMVMQFEYDPHGYASALLMLEKNNVMRQTIAVAASGQRNDLLQRIEKILGADSYRDKKRKTPDFQKLGGLLAGLICVVALNALFFFGSPVIENHSVAFSAFSNPFYQLVSDGQESSAIEKPIEKKKKEIQLQTQVATKVVHEKKRTETVIKVNVAPEVRFVYSKPETVNGFAPVDLRMHLEQKLKRSEINQVKGAVAATKKVLEEGQWKQVEKNIADALTEAEKQNVKEKYLSDVEKINWPKLEEKLKLSYNQINWTRVDAQLGAAITNIKLDSLTTVYNLALDDLDKAQDWMNENKVESIPDTDVKLNEIEVQKEQVEKQLKTIKAIKAKKIIHL